MRCLFFKGRSGWPWDTSEVPTTRSTSYYRGDEGHHGFESRILQERRSTTVDSREIPSSWKFRCFKLAGVHPILLLEPGGSPFDLSPGWDRGSGRWRRTLRKPINSKLTRCFSIFLLLYGCCIIFDLCVYCPKKSFFYYVVVCQKI